ncbi:MAG: alpha/beta hydrolase [Pseudomonadota bacterium]
MAGLPFHFGESARTLFGTIHEGDSARAPAILLCNPFGEEAIRAFRIQRILADRLAVFSAGVLRFDYYGTGDAAGEDAAACLSGFVEDILTAHEELSDISNAQHVLWIGLGLGGAAAVQAALQTSASELTPPKGLLLWSPVMNGRHYLTDLRRGHAKITHNAEDQILDEEALGFPLSKKLINELQGFDISEHASASSNRIDIITANGAEHSHLSGSKVSHHIVADADMWNSDEAMNAYFVPVETISLIETLVREWR